MLLGNSRSGDAYGHDKNSVGKFSRLSWIAQRLGINTGRQDEGGILTTSESDSIIYRDTVAFLAPSSQGGET